ncbi:MAG: hydrolase [Legionellaceae bacterium]|nr:hydrolase [Legionellaceae bacterium]
MIITSTFKPAWWLSNSHAQTIFRSFTKRQKAPITQLERLELPDGDFIDLAWATHRLPATAPLVILLHGLGGSIDSSYVAGQLKAYNQHGWRAVFMHFRGASQEANRLPRAYHSGETTDLDFLLKTLNAREPNTKKAVVGVSLGGNVLLKWLGEQGEQSLIDTSIAISTPFELGLLATHMNQGFARIYQRYLINNLRVVFKRKLKKHPHTIDKYLKNIDSLRSFWEFDEQITAPLHGFPDAKTYYEESSSRQFLKQIKTPTLIIHASDDPFMPLEAIPALHHLSPQVTLELSAKGGHVGFISGKIPGKPRYWLDERTPQFLALTLNGRKPYQAESALNL